jgi:hypothetical protein
MNRYTQVTSVVTITHQHPEKLHAVGSSGKGKVFLSEGMMGRFGLQPGDQVLAILAKNSRNSDIPFRAVRIYPNRSHPMSKERVRMVWDPEDCPIYAFLKARLVDEQDGPYSPDECVDLYLEDHEYDRPKTHLFFEVSRALEFLAETGHLYESRIFEPGRMHMFTTYFGALPEMILPVEIAREMESRKLAASG